tara:strand:- start:899 stop:1114 length:216 start_codon:yes stop_codon:yes gene_type:complete
MLRVFGDMDFLPISHAKEFNYIKLIRIKEEEKKEEERRDREREKVNERNSPYFYETSTTILTIGSKPLKHG